MILELMSTHLQREWDTFAAEQHAVPEHPAAQSYPQPVDTMCKRKCPIDAVCAGLLD